MDRASETKLTPFAWFKENLLSFFFALFLFFVIRSSVVEAFKIPSGSMIPTLMIGDHLLVNKFAYGLKIPFSEWVADHPVYWIKRLPPTRGDVIVFVYPKDESLYYIKRVVGTPGDTVEVRSKILYLNGKPVDRHPLEKTASEALFKSLGDQKYNSESLTIYREKLASSEHLMMTDRHSYLGENFPAVKIPPDHLFVMGDNRDFSNDSRFWGFVPYTHVKGKATFIWLSYWPQFSESRLTWHSERIGLSIH